MLSISLFVEDFGHEEFLVALIGRIAREQDVQIAVHPRSVRGGRGKVLSELSQYVTDIDRGREYLPDLLIVATDANCKGYGSRKREVEEVVSSLEQKHPGILILAIPDPHIERWMLIDSHAFKAVLGRGCNAPDLKCERQRYKLLLLRAMEEAGIVPPLGGMEYARDIVEHLALEKMNNLDKSLALTVNALQNRLRNT